MKDNTLAGSFQNQNQVDKWSYYLKYNYNNIYRYHVQYIIVLVISNHLSHWFFRSCHTVDSAFRTPSPSPTFLIGFPCFRRCYFPDLSRNLDIWTQIITVSIFANIAIANNLIVVVIARLMSTSRCELRSSEDQDIVPTINYFYNTNHAWLHVYNYYVVVILLLDLLGHNTQILLLLEVTFIWKTKRWIQ